MSVSTSAQIDEILASFTAKPNGIPGVVFRVVRKDGAVLYEGCSGVLGLDSKQPMTSDTLFWVASFTKVPTVIGVLQLVEQGKVCLDEPAEKYVPELGKIKILEGFDADDKPIYREPKTKITLRHLITHTSGHTYEFFNPNTLKHNQQHNVSRTFSTKRDTITAPLAFEPGTQWEYGVGVDWAGLVIEAVSGQRLDAYLEQHVFRPLGCQSSTFLVPDASMARHAHLHARAADGSLTERAHEIVGASEVEMCLGGAGLHTTATDYCAVLLALLNGGVGATGARILRADTVESMFEDQTTPRGISIDKPLPSTIPYITNPVSVALGVPKGWSLAGLKMGVELPSGRSAGSVWWAGSANCFWWADKTTGVIGVIMTQILPFADAQVFQCWEAIEKKIYEDLRE